VLQLAAILILTFGGAGTFRDIPGKAGKEQIL